MDNKTNKIIIATGVYLSENNSATPQNIQDFIIKYFGEIRIPLDEISEYLTVLCMAGFIKELEGEFSRVNFEKEIIKKEKDIIPLFAERKLWSVEL